MRRSGRIYLVYVALFNVVAVAHGSPATGMRGVVATVHPIATDAAVEVLRKGGNAIDAAVAAALTLGVVDNHNSGLGGGCFILVRLSDGRLAAVDGRETAPVAATRDMFVRDGKAQTASSQTGPLAVGVPGALAAYGVALERYGRLKLADLLLPAATVAQHGFAIDRVYAGNLAETASLLAKFQGSRSVLLRPDGSAYREGELLVQPDLARTYSAIAKHGPDWFYRGPFAKAVGQWMAEHGGILTAADFAEYRAKLRQPVVSTYRGYTVAGFPPPSSGGIHVAQILNILECFDLKAAHQTDPSLAVHIMAEAMKLAFADRAHWLGDSDFSDVPCGLVEKSYAADLAKQIDPERATAVERHGMPPRWNMDMFNGNQAADLNRKHTTHIAAADADGNWVAITATVNTSFGSKIIVPGTGVVLNNEMDDFSLQPGVPNAFGLVGADANAVEPGKRPLSSMSPTIVLRDGQPVLTLGAGGGPKIITQAVLTIVRYIDLGLSIDKAVASPRFHHQWLPNRLMFERPASSELVESLQRRGHEVDWLESAGVMQAIALSPRGKGLIGVHDPRVPGKAAGY